MRIAYVGTLNQGGTCLMRGEMLAEMLPGSSPFFVDTRYRFKHFNRIKQSVGFRFKRGPLIKKVNDHVSHQLDKHDHFDFIWVDKAIYLTPSTTRSLKEKTSCLIHYTPDTAFFANRSKWFFEAMNIYNFIVTTKSFDTTEYLKYIPADKLILCTQGYDPRFHKPYFQFREKKHDIAFIGLHESHREEMLQKLLDHGLSLTLGGVGWAGFVKRNRYHPQLSFIGSFISKEEYGEAISSAYFSPGLVSRKFPELHTTRTFEIPACGTALLTESNAETRSFFNDDEAIFYSSLDEMIEKIIYFKNNLVELEHLTQKGSKRVLEDGRDYKSILKEVLLKAGVLDS